MKGLSWTCHVCRERRPDDKISVYKTDQSEMYGFPPGSVTQNVRYCNDRQDCIDRAPMILFGRPPKEKDATWKP